MHLTVTLLDLGINAYWQNYYNPKACITRFQYVFLVYLLFGVHGKWSMKISIGLPRQKSAKCVRF